jgi:hypothetical protein
MFEKLLYKGVDLIQNRFVPKCASSMGLGLHAPKLARIFLFLLFHGVEIQMSARAY